MAIEKTVIIKVKSEQAAKDLKDINSIIDEQRDILVLLEEEYIKAKKALDNYNKSGKVNLSQEKQLKQALSERKDALTDQRLGLKKLAVEQRESNKAIKVGQKLQKENINIVRAIDKLTGGYATKVIKLKKGFVSGFGAVKNFVKGLSGIKKALIATGIGALIVGLATVVAYWEEITALFDNGSKALQKQADEQRKNIQLSDEQLALLDQQEKLLTIQGKSTETIVAEKKKVLLLQQEQNEALLQTLKLQLQKEQSQVRELSFFEKLKAASLEALGQYEAAAKIRVKGMMASEEELNKIKELEEEIQQSRLKGSQIDIALATIDKNKKDAREKDAKDRKTKDDKELKEIERKNKEKLRLEKEFQDRLKNLKDRIRDAEAVTEEEQRALKLEKLKEEHTALMAEALANGLLSEELITSLKQREKDLLAQFKQEDADTEEKRKKDEAETEQIAADYKEKQYRETYNNLQDVIALGGKKMEKVGKALAIADVVRSSVKSVSETISSTGIANAKAAAASPLTLGMPFVGINTAMAALSIGSTVAGATKSIQAIKGDAKSVGGAAVPSSGGGGGSAPSIPPAFNVVGSSDSNQLADAIGGQTQQPVQAYVVANDVTTAQSLQNNIVEGATIG